MALLVQINKFHGFLLRPDHFMLICIYISQTVAVSSNKCNWVIFLYKLICFSVSKRYQNNEALQNYLGFQKNITSLQSVL